MPVPDDASPGRHSRHASDASKSHRRDRTKSSQSYLQRPARRENPANAPRASHASPPLPPPHPNEPDSPHAAPLARLPPAAGATKSPRPRLKDRAHSAPLVPKAYLPGAEKTARSRNEDNAGADAGDDEGIADDPFFQRLSTSQTGTADDGQHSPTDSQGGSTDTEGPLSPTSTAATSAMKARPDSSAEPMSPLGPRSPMWPDNSARMEEINIAVLGGRSVGKTTFIQLAFDLRMPPPSRFSSRKMSIDGKTYLVRFVELGDDDYDLDTEQRIAWPSELDGISLSSIDGVFTLYDVMNKESLVNVPETLGGICRASLPLMLVACKCDFPPAHRHVDPAGVKKRARASLGDIEAYQTSQATPDSQKRCVAVLLRLIVAARARNHHAFAAARRRANSSAVHRISPRPQSYKHARANSEFSTKAMHRPSDDPYYPPPSPPRLGAKSKSSQHLPVADGPDRAAYDSAGSEPEAASDAEPARRVDKPASTEVGYSFDELVDKLLAQPMSKTDSKFASVFLALYRKFAAPSLLLDSIITRFDTLSITDSPKLNKSATKLRYLNILAQWLGLYPGDFAHPSTRRTMASFVSRLGGARLLAHAAEELANDLEFAIEDDDTEWAFSDRNRERHALLAAGSPPPKQPVPHPGVPVPVPRAPGLAPASSSSQTMLAAVAAAQRVARSLVPTPRLPLTKVQWHALVDVSDEIVSKELTRMDWALFSALRPRDLVRYVSVRGEARGRYRGLEHVQRMIDHFNHVAAWVANLVLLREKPKHRAVMLEKFMRVARELRRLNNYNSLGAVLAGLHSSAVHRLQASKDLVPVAAGRDFMKLEILMSATKSHAAYRLAWENTSGPRIPYIPLHKRDLVSAEEGNRTFIGLEDGGREEERWARGVVDPKARVNWRKFEVVGEVIVGIQRAQGVPYPQFKACEEVRVLVVETAVVRDEDWLWDRSLQLEPSGGGGKKRFPWSTGFYN
ncbi:ras GEF [Trichodelitschia bisporula]|uniref:Ras GEF n=1 Tax=Trichodelitschia bisporula TaxID=703511 RepID=A0A6G1I9P8_9PEZI|nr:ras GEF [Trichodelitschia bisporula]